MSELAARWPGHDRPAAPSGLCLGSTLPAPKLAGAVKSILAIACGVVDGARRKAQMREQRSIAPQLRRDDFPSAWRLARAAQDTGRRLSEQRPPGAHLLLGPAPAISCWARKLGEGKMAAPAHGGPAHRRRGHSPLPSLISSNARTPPVSTCRSPPPSAQLHYRRD